MQVSLESLGKLERRMQVQVPAEQVSKEINSRLKQLSRTARLKGFRPGKAPLTVIRQQFGPQVHREVIGAGVQTITPTMAAGLGLPQDFGVIVSDVTPKGPADTAGLKVQDIVLTLDGKPVVNVPQFDAAFQFRTEPAPLQLEVIRATETVSLQIPVVEQHDDMDRLADSLDPAKDLIPKLGILGVQIDRDIAAMVPSLRMASGVIVAARTANGAAVDSGLEAGDVIHALNGTTIISLDTLSASIQQLKPGDPVVLQIERNGGLHYLAFEME